jgi:carboxyl-terminal processing protease
MVESGIGYVKVISFGKGKSSEIANKIKSLQKNGAKKLILDLRDASDGEMSEAVATANLFLNHGTIGYLQGQKYPKETYTADPQKAVTTLPLVVLVNRGTAGPGELVASAVLENNRGDVLGDKTFGMGSVQKVIDLPGGAGLILSVAKYYTPGGKALQDAAVTPNILVADKDDDFPLPDEDADTPKDKDEPLRKHEKTTDEQLKRAIEVVKNQTQKASS